MNKVSADPSSDPRKHDPDDYRAAALAQEMRKFGVERTVETATPEDLELIIHSLERFATSDVPSAVPTRYRNPHPPGVWPYEGPWPLPKTPKEALADMHPQTEIARLRAALGEIASCVDDANPEVRDLARVAREALDGVSS